MGDAVEVESGMVDACGAPLWYQLAGVGQPLVLIHEGLADSRMYDDQFEVLARRHRVIRYDLHGFGRSGTPNRPYTHHQALHALLRHLHIEHAALLGMSLGGIVALDFALSYPRSVDALLLLAAGIGGYPPGAETQALATPMAEAFKAGNFVQAIDLSVRFWVDGPSRTPEQVDSAVRERVRTLYTEVLRRSRDGGRPPEPLVPAAYTRLGDIHAPALVVVGANDVPDIRDQADLLARTIPGARNVVLPHAAHLLNMEHPATVNRMVLDFLATLPPHAV